MRRRFFNLGFLVCFAFALAMRADIPQVGVKTPEDLRRDAAIAEFTAKQEKANWPEKFDRIGKEMGVPPDILAAVAFAETRWDHLTWPPGETVSPENGMPRPYGIMSLMDNEYFGHSLIEAAKLIGHTPEELKQDPELNIRGGAALLKKLYQENPLPEGTTTNDIESWQTAIQKYSGIPEDYLSYDHVYACYVYMTQGYDEYGMHWKPHDAKLDPMKKKRDSLWKEQNVQVKSETALTPAQFAAAAAPSPPKLMPVEPEPEKVSVTNVIPASEVKTGFIPVLALLVSFATGVIFWMLLKQKNKN